MGRHSNGKAGRPNGATNKLAVDPSIAKATKAAEELVIDEIKPDGKIRKQVRNDPNDHRRW